MHEPRGHGAMSGGPCTAPRDEADMGIVFIEVTRSCRCAGTARLGWTVLSRPGWSR